MIQNKNIITKRTLAALALLLATLAMSGCCPCWFESHSADSAALYQAPGRPALNRHVMAAIEDFGRKDFRQPDAVSIEDAQKETAPQVAAQEEVAQKEAADPTGAALAFAVWMRAQEAASREEGAFGPPDLWGWAPRDLAEFQRVWNNIGPGAGDQPDASDLSDKSDSSDWSDLFAPPAGGPACALEQFGVGGMVERPEDARPGDFIEWVSPGTARLRTRAQSALSLAPAPDETPAPLPEAAPAPARPLHRRAGIFQRWIRDRSSNQITGFRAWTAIDAPAKAAEAASPQPASEARSPLAQPPLRAGYIEVELPNPDANSGSLPPAASPANLFRLSRALIPPARRAP